MTAMSTWDGPERRRSHADVSALAHEARELAQAAVARVERHEEVCTHRYGRIQEVLDEVKDAVRGLYTRWWTIVMMVILGLLGVIGALLSKYVLP